MGIRKLTDPSLPTVEQEFGPGLLGEVLGQKWVGMESGRDTGGCTHTENLSFTKKSYF